MYDGSNALQKLKKMKRQTKCMKVEKSKVDEKMSYRGVIPWLYQGLYQGLYRGLYRCCSPQLPHATVCESVCNVHLPIMCSNIVLVFGPFVLRKL